MAQQLVEDRQTLRHLGEALGVWNVKLPLPRLGWVATPASWAFCFGVLVEDMEAVFVRLLPGLPAILSQTQLIEVLLPLCVEVSKPSEAIESVVDDRWADELVWLALQDRLQFLLVLRIL